MKRISKDSPLLFLTFVTNHRLPVFRTSEFAKIAATAFDEARRSGSFTIHAYAIMPDHVHMVTGNERKPSDILRFLKGISARRVIGHLKDKGHGKSLAKLRVNSRSGTGTHSLWQHHSNTFLITSEHVLLQKVNYIHLNPVKEGLVDFPSDFQFTSARIWEGSPKDDEPLEVDFKEILWSSR